MGSVSSSDAKLYNSSFDGDIEGVIAALAQGGRVTMRNPEGFTPLLIAAQKGHTVKGLFTYYVSQNWGL